MAFPDGRNASAYSGLAKASFRRLAWEFLRRNPDYQKDCLSVKAGTLDAKRAARKWGLKTFKDYRRGFFKPQRTTFNIGRVRFYSASFVRSRRLSLNLMPGEVAVVFDLNDIKKYRQVFDAKMINAARGIERRARKMHGTIETKAENIKIVSTGGTLIRYLRAFDLYNSGVTPTEIQGELHSSDKNMDGTYDNPNRGRDDLIAGKKYVAGEYLKLAVKQNAMKKRPTLRIPRKKKKKTNP